MAEKMFDPKASQESGDLPSFEGLIALVWAKREQAKGKSSFYLRGKYEVCTGPYAGKTFFANQSLDLSVSAGRLGVWCAAVGQQDAFDINDEKALRAVFLRKPFKAQVERKENGAYINHDIKRFTMADKLTDAERKAAAGWILDQDEKRALGGGGHGGDDGDPGPGDDDIPF